MATDAVIRGDFGPTSERHLEVFAALAAPFANDEVRSRSQGGRDFQYVTARTVMNRLDEVLGPAGWWDEYVPMENAVICKLTVRLPDGSTLTKSDAGGMSKMQDESDTEKSAFSDAFKRTAVKFGVARYLYGDGVPQSIRQELIRARQEQRAAGREPGGDDDREPQIEPAHREPPRQSGGGGYGGSDRSNDRPRNGKALFAWAKNQEEKTGLAVIKTINDYGQMHRWAARMIQWDNQQVDKAVDEALAYIQNARG